MQWNIYLSGEIHTGCRDQTIKRCKEHALPVTVTSAVTNHEASDSGSDVLGSENILKASA